VNLKFSVQDLQLRVEALELLLISRGDTNKENLSIFRKEAEQNYVKIREDFRQEQWGKIKLGHIVEYEVFPGNSVYFEVINVSAEPFKYIAGKVKRKEGKLKCKVGEIYTINSPFRLTLHSGIGYPEMLSRE